MEKNKEKKYVVITMLLNLLANSQFVEANEYPFPLRYHFDWKCFLIVTIFIMSVAYIKRR